MGKLFEDAYFWILYYKRLEDSVDEIRRYLQNPENRDEYGFVKLPYYGQSECVTLSDIEPNHPNVFLRMCLVGMFGDYGTSPLYGWITKPDDACEWLYEKQQATFGQCNFDNGEDACM